MFPPELEANAFRTENGEFGWTRTQVPLVVDVLRSQGLAILGGELWWVREGVAGWDLIPQRNGPSAVYSWETESLSGEPWVSFVERSAANTLAAMAIWPTHEDLPPNLPGRVLCNLTWISEVKYEKFSSEAT